MDVRDYCIIVWIIDVSANVGPRGPAWSLGVSPACDNVDPCTPGVSDWAFRTYAPSWLWPASRGPPQ